jgi:hypothetical protein
MSTARTLALGLLLLCLADAAWAQTYATGEQVRAAVSGKTMTGVNSYGNPYTYKIQPNGTITGVLGKLNEFDDRGVWTVEGNKWCLHWELWLNSEKVCYDVILDGNQITRVAPDGTRTETSTLSGG